MRLVKEKNGIDIDGMSHAKVQLVVHSVVTFVTIVMLYMEALRNNVDLVILIDWVTLVNQYLLAGMAVYWVLVEFFQEWAMVKDGRHAPNRHWKFWTWYQGRYQDIGLPVIIGTVFTGFLTLGVFIYKGLV